MAVAINTSGIHHMALRCTDLARSRQFYAETLEFPVVLEGPEIFLFLAGATAIAVRGPGAETPHGDVFSPFRVGLDHIALACSHERELKRVAAALTAQGVANTGIRVDETLQRAYVAFKDPDLIAWELYMAPNLVVPAVEAYLDGLRQHKLDTVPFADEVTFESPLAMKVKGVAAVKEALAAVLPAVQDISSVHYISEGDYVATSFELHTPFGTIPIFDRFRVVNGAITEIRPFYDPRPIVEGLSRTSA